MRADSDRGGGFRWDLTTILIIMLLLAFLALLWMEIGPLDHTSREVGARMNARVTGETRSPRTGSNAPVPRAGRSCRHSQPIRQP
jgi:hypothetical protein